MSMSSSSECVTETLTLDPHNSSQSHPDHDRGEMKSLHIHASGSEKQLSISDRVLRALEAGYSAPEIARKFNVSLVFVKVMVEHFQRLGFTENAQTLCSSGLGACGSNGASTIETQVACAGCPLAVMRK